MSKIEVVTADEDVNKDGGRLVAEDEAQLRITTTPILKLKFKPRNWKSRHKAPTETRQKLQSEIRLRWLQERRLRQLQEIKRRLPPGFMLRLL